MDARPSAFETWMFRAEKPAEWPGSSLLEKMMQTCSSTDTLYNAYSFERAWMPANPPQNMDVLLADKIRGLCKRGKFGRNRGGDENEAGGILAYFEDFIFIADKESG
jgi:hypothetical protein